MDEVKLGIGAICALGMAGLLVILFSASNGSANTDAVTAFSLSIGGLIAALVRGGSGAGGS